MLTHNHANHYLTQQPAFTLIELVLAILLTAIVAYNILPRFFNNIIFSQNLFVQNAQSALYYAQNLAMGSGCHISVTPSATQITLNLRSSCTSGTFTITVQDPSNTSNSFVKTAPTGVTMTYNNFPLYFDQNGQGRLVSNNATTNATLTVTGGGISTITNIKGAQGQISS